jgi:hypothetical protein
VPSSKMKTRHSYNDWIYRRIAAVLSSVIVTVGLAADLVRADIGSRPNIVFLYTDDQAQWAMGAYGNRDIKTPHLDSLARSGAIFRDVFTVTPVNAVQLMRYRHISAG